MLAGTSGVAASRRFGAWKPPTRAVGEVPPQDVERLVAEWADGDRGRPPADLRTVFAVAAAKRALAHARMPAGPHPRAGAAVASGPGAHRIEDFVRATDARGVFDAAVFA